MKHDVGGPADPCGNVKCSQCGSYATEVHQGKSLLDWFAGLIRAGYESREDGGFGTPDGNAFAAYNNAAAMLAEKRRREEDSSK